MHIEDKRTRNVVSITLGIVVFLFGLFLLAIIGLAVALSGGDPTWNLDSVVVLAAGITLLATSYWIIRRPSNTAYGVALVALLAVVIARLV